MGQQVYNNKIASVFCLLSFVLDKKVKK